MIKQTKLKKFRSCNNCGGYNAQSHLDSETVVLECGEIYEYIIGHGVEVRLCNKCARELKDLLEMQLKVKEMTKSE